VDRPAVADYPPGAGLPPRVIRDFEFVWMLRGRATFVVDEETLLTPGELLLVPPHVRHSFRWDHEQPSRHGYVHFGYADVSRAIAPDVRLTRMSDSDPLAGLCAYLLWLGGSDLADWQVSVRRTLEFMLALVADGPLPSQDAAPEVAGYADVAHFSHRFSTIHGMSPSAYRSLSNRSSSVMEEPGVLRLSRLVWDR
jgi:AraC-like DNA-binding protein